MRIIENFRSFIANYIVLVVFAVEFGRWVGYWERNLGSSRLRGFLKIIECLQISLSAANH